MKYIVFIIIGFLSGYCGKFLYYKTNLDRFAINTLRINSKKKIFFLDFILIAIGLNFLSNIMINYKDIVSDLGTFVVILLMGLLDALRIEVQYYKDKEKNNMGQ